MKIPADFIHPEQKSEHSKRWQGLRQTRLRQSEAPLRAELLSVEQLARHARSLATGHLLDRQHNANRLLARLDANEQRLREFNHTTLAVNPNLRITPAAEWLLDNFYLIEEQIQMARRHLPRGYSRELPRLLQGPSAGLPRVYDIVLELISHVDAQIDEGPLKAFIAAYQSVCPLTLGELWAIPIMLRLGLIENLQRITTRLKLAQADSNLAGQWVERLQEMAEKKPGHLVVVVADMAKSDLPISPAFVAEFCQLLSRHSPVLHIARSWLDHLLVEQGLSIEVLVHLESQNQAADQVSVSHSIASLRSLTSLDWRSFVESLSGVEEILQQDPAGIYSGMDFATRDRYRHAVEQLAHLSPLSEAEVAKTALQMAQAYADQNGSADRIAHVGYYLIDKGYRLLSQRVKLRWNWQLAIEQSIQRFPLPYYLLGILLLTLLASLGLCLATSALGLQNWEIWCLGVVFLPGASQLAVTLMNSLSMVLVRPKRLPRLDFSEGIPCQNRTMVVVPTMLTSPEGIDRLIEAIEVCHLSNRDPCLHFALLTDFCDAKLATLPEDQTLLERVMTGINRLNQKYLGERQDLFYLFHRPRRWNAAEGLWMGYERKRGKLEEFNALLRGSESSCFAEIVGDTTILADIRYVITLDTDTQLPRDAARRLVATMAHPLNHPVFDPERNVVTDGYTILQPRVGVSLTSARISRFVRLCAGDAGLDPYTREVSDVYQDVFHEGTFIGKGIYDVDAFQRALHDRFPENTVLSHDLLEACHARSALVSDVELFEAYPSRYNVDMDRRHRWIRGDWQILQWLWPRVPGTDGKLRANPLSGLSCWKIFDNLRRSLVPSSLMGLMLCSWLMLAAAGNLGLWLVLGLMILPGLLAAISDLPRKPADLSWRMFAQGLLASWQRQFGQLLLGLTFLPYEAFVNLDAIGRTLLRMLVTHKHRLEWQTSGDSERKKNASLVGFYATMWVAPLTALASCVFLLNRSPSPLLLAGALPMLLAWFFSPWLAWWISQPIVSSQPELNHAQLSFLRHTARKTWSFFETFVNDQENWLPPDNFQEIPAATIASRTSPTNMGLALLANLAAWDMGYLSQGAMIQRIQNTLATLYRLERYRGHFYNWYETRTLQPLQPLYVSSVDSGNLAGHLLTLGAGLREQSELLLFRPQILTGLCDTLNILHNLLGENPALEKLEALLGQTPAGLTEAFGLLQKASTLAGEIAAALANPLKGARPDPEASAWAQTLVQDCQGHFEELMLLCPWLLLPVVDQGPVELAPSDQARLDQGLESELAEKWAQLDQGLTLQELVNLAQSLCPLIARALQDLALLPGAAAQNRHQYLTTLQACFEKAWDHAQQRLNTLAGLAAQVDELAEMDFTFLFDTAKDLFSVGFNVSERRCDTSCYDLLASEARLCSYVAIALGQVPQEHWFSLGRLLLSAHGESMLVSWSGSMFEYLMPMLVMPSYEHTLLDQTCLAAVQQQIEYGQLRGVPWGISESGYNRTDVNMNYQYRAFGVPGLGLKRGLAEDLVIAPYASAMALMVAPLAACLNLQRLALEGRAGGYGFYEAVDYTPVRLPPAETSVTIRSYMAHHQGMTLLALVKLLQDAPMQRRFLASPLLKAADLLLQERVPKTAAGVFVEDLTRETLRTLAADPAGVMRVFTNPSPALPDVHLLSNGRYHVMISSAGGGYSRWRDLALTRWREDGTRDNWGCFVYLRDLTNGEFWSTAYQPTLIKTKGYEAIFTQARAEFRHRHAGLEVHTEICVSPEDDIELRRMTISNRSPVTRVIELTSYTEAVLATQDADAAHPAFSNLFVQTEFLPADSALLCTRRARSQAEQPPWLLHLLVDQTSQAGDISCETDRGRFVGRGGSLARPAVMEHALPLSNTVGAVLDPILSLRRSVTLLPDESVILDLVLGVAENRETALALIEKYQSPRMADRAFDLAWTHSQVTLRHLNASESESQLYTRLASALIYADATRRASPGVLRHNRRGQSGLWSYGISGDAPIVLLCINDAKQIAIVGQLIQAHAYWRMKGLAVELVILNEDISVYRQSLYEQIISLIASGIEAQMLDKPGGIFVRRLEQMTNEDRGLLLSAARIVFYDEQGSLLEQMEPRRVLDPPLPLLIPTRSSRRVLPQPLAARELLFDNGFGGFTRDGNEYVITLQPGQMTPAPWVNVIANPSFGTVLSESGSAYTWFENAHEFRLTPWSNDPIQDPSGEALYIRDEQTGQFWSPTPLPARGQTPYVIRHGFGYTVYEHNENGIVSELWIYVAMDAPVKFTVLKLRNVSGRARRLSVTGYCEWVLGDLRNKSLLHVQTEVDLKTGALLVRNHYNTEFSDRIVFFDVNEPTRTLTGDRKEFLGRNGSLAQPAALKRSRLSGKVGTGLDPCGALQVVFDLPDGQMHETSFRLGVGRHTHEVQDLIQRFRGVEACLTALEGVWSYWNRTLGTINLDTPNPAVNVIANGWLMYQTLSCRLWGRTGFYQSGGAYGFRDQLQDVMALVHAEPALTRAHLLLAARHQFLEGDVQHWWHPPAGRGVRTHFSDDLLWLPYVTCRYVMTVADTGVLAEMIPFLEAQALKPDEEACYDLPNRSENSATLYQHCVLAIEKGLNYGAHGLPLIGCGDWNDGMNRVGHAGRGESVWLAFFLYDVLTQFAHLARAYQDPAFAERCLAHARQLQLNIEAQAWDGEWYLRAFFDSGEALGSHHNEECQIDSLPQSWSVISKAGDSERSLQALKSVDQRLVRRDAGLIQLFDPPFDHSSLDPGYIKGYIPGVRENGGQYTHGAIWTAMAFARTGQTEKAWELFDLLNPVHHGGTAAQIATYKVEPYVIAADVYAVAPHTGRGGWTWYTGSAAWMYRLLIETLLGVNREGDQLRLTPCMPKSWPSYKIHYRYRQTVYHITISRGNADGAEVNQLFVDGEFISGVCLPLIDDQHEHIVEFKLGVV